MVTRKTDEKEIQSENKEEVIVSPGPLDLPPVIEKRSSLLPALLAIIALALSGYTVFSLYSLQKQQTEKFDSLTHEVSELKETQTRSDSQLDSTTKLINQSQNSLEEKVQTQLNQFNENLEKIVQQSHFQKQDWQLMQARYYLEVAQINAQWSNDTETTLVLLRKADSVLAEFKDQRFFAVRQAIAKEIAAVEAIPRNDLPGLLSQLDAVQDLVSNLPLRRPAFTMEDSNNNTSNPSEKTTPWRAHLRNSLNKLSQLVVVRRNNDPYQPLLGPKEEGFARTLLRLNLQEAQWAVIQLNDSIYQFALKQAIKNIQLTFDTNDIKTQTIMSKIQELQKTRLTKPSLTLDQSLPLINSLIATNETNAVSNGDSR